MDTFPCWIRLLALLLSLQIRRRAKLYRGVSGVQNQPQIKDLKQIKMFLDIGRCFICSLRADREAFVTVPCLVSFLLFVKCFLFEDVGMHVLITGYARASMRSLPGTYLGTHPSSSGHYSSYLGRYVPRYQVALNHNNKTAE